MNEKTAYCILALCDNGKIVGLQEYKTKKGEEGYAAVWGDKEYVHLISDLDVAKQALDWINYLPAGCPGKPFIANYDDNIFGDAVNEDAKIKLIADTIRANWDRVATKCNCEPGWGADLLAREIAKALR